MEAKSTRMFLCPLAATSALASRQWTAQAMSHLCAQDGGVFPVQPLNASGQPPCVRKQALVVAAVRDECAQGLESQGTGFAHCDKGSPASVSQQALTVAAVRDECARSLPSQGTCSAQLQQGILCLSHASDPQQKRHGCSSPDLFDAFANPHGHCIVQQRPTGCA